MSYVVDTAAREIAEDMISAARSAPLTEPVQFVTGNSYMPPLRSYSAAETIWQADNPNAWEELTETLDRLLDEANVILDCPDWDNTLYVVDIARFEYVGDSETDGDTLHDDWAPIAPADSGTED